MNKSEFISLIEHPEAPGKSHITALKQITADFPYFQCAQVLLTKALYNEHHYEFEKHLKHTSLMIPDRAVLFRYIHNLKEAAEAYKPADQLPQPAFIPVPEVTETPVLKPDATEIIHEIVDELLETKTGAVPDHVKTISPLYVETTVNEQKIEEKQIEEIVLPATEEISHPLIVPVSKEENILNPEETGKVTEQTEELTVNSSESHSFTEWLQLQKNKKIIEAPAIIKTESQATEEPAAELKDEPAVTTAGLVPDESEEKIQEAGTPSEAKTNIADFESILDKFIRENPRISRPKAEFYNPVNMAKQSVEQDDELVTETLANVYYKQGHYKKAIRAYEKLCLIYPHKMTYFASLIQKIKTENKD